MMVGIYRLRGEIQETPILLQTAIQFCKEHNWEIARFWRRLNIPVGGFVYHRGTRAQWFFKIKVQQHPYH